MTRNSCTLFTAIVLVAAAGASAQTSGDGVWTTVSDAERNALLAARSSQEFNVRPQRFATFRLNASSFQAVVADTPLERLDLPLGERPVPDVVTVPMPDGTFARFGVVESPVMHPDLAAKYPEIRTYVGQGLDDPGASVRLDQTPEGFHAQVLTPNGAVYVDPLFKGGDEYASYLKSDYVRSDIAFQCLVDDEGTPVSASRGATRDSRSGSQLRTYRLAIACNGEYSEFHGGTVNSVLSEVVTAVNRVTGIYEIELAIRLQLIANNDAIIYLDPNADPYTNDDAFALLDENQANLDAVIGSANYDIGHVFTTGSGGLAGLGVVCNSNSKAWGTTGLSNPVNDPFYVDYVSHEIGHQFDGSHTFNGLNGSCNGNRSGSSAYEPGSGSTIQAYAGICSADNLQANSDPYFHSRSFDQMFDYATSLGTCAVTTATGNNEPTADAGPDYFLPRSTPFTLTGSGSDADAGDVLTYCWEQRDLGPAAALITPDDGEIPLFRSFPPTTSSSRTFPQWSTILANVVDNAEKLPVLPRNMDFRLTVRDNRAGGGGVATDDMRLIVDEASGPFLVTFPNGGEAVSGLQNVTWDVAGTSSVPISAATVDIYLSVDSGATFGTLLAEGVPNVGSAQVSIPEIVVDTARIMVQPADNVFFDVSNSDFSIFLDLDPDDPVTFESTDVPVNIEDLSTVTSTIVIPDDIVVLDVDVTLDITHTFVADLDVELEGPSGTRVTLFEDVGSSGNDFDQTTLDDEAGMSILTGTAPFAGTFVPIEALSNFDFEGGQGTWTLRITDDFGGDLGTLNSWSLTITPAIDPADTIYVDFDFAGLESGTEFHPFNTLTEGAAAVNEGGTILIYDGSTSETIIMDQAVTIDNAEAGVATIGAAP